MNFIIAALFGVVQGITEFLPISSSGHLILLHAIFPNFAFSNDVVFDVALHVGTLTALLIVLWRDVCMLVHGFVAWCRHPLKPPSADERNVLRICIAIVPAFFIGAFFDNIIETSLRSTGMVALMLVLVALLFFWLESRPASTRSRSLTQLSLCGALLIGIGQTLAFIPGTSRSGITIAAGMLLGLRREDAARFSFLIAMPLVAGAGLKKLVDLSSMQVAPNEFLLLGIGFLSSAGVGIVVIRFLLRYLRTHSLRPFAWYRIILAAVILVFSFITI